MKSLSLRFIEKILKILARLTIAKYQPGIIGVTGTVGKTSTKDAIYTVLRTIRRVRVSRGNFNGQIGIPLTILGEWRDEELKLLSREYPPKAKRLRKLVFLLKVILISSFRFFFGLRSSYPELLVLEYAADKPGDLKELVAIARPQIGVITAVGEIPAHVEFYSNPEAVAREKSRLIESLLSTGFAVLNGDDEMILGMKEKTRAHIITFGFDPEVEVRIANFELRVEKSRPTGISFKIDYGGSSVPFRIDQAFGKPVAYAAAAAAAVGIVFGMHLVRVAEAIAYFEPPPHRMKIIPGIKGTLLLDDSYNASPLSVAAAIETVKSLGGQRKIAVLGDMLEIGKFALEAHENIGKLVPKVFDILITAGPRAKFIAEAAIENGMAKRNVFKFDEVSEELLGKIVDLIKKGDLILIKASWAMGFMKIVHAIKQI